MDAPRVTSADFRYFSFPSPTTFPPSGASPFPPSLSPSPRPGTPRRCRRQQAQPQEENEGRSMRRNWGRSLPSDPASPLPLSPFSQSSSLPLTERGSGDSHTVTLIWQRRTCSRATDRLDSSRWPFFFNSAARRPQVVPEAGAAYDWH